jgi:hypothetical protein
VLGLVRSMKNHFAPINRVPPEVFSLIPKYLDKRDMDKALTALTHTCRSWRELLVACPSLWARLDCANVDRTRVYVERAKSSPLEITLYWDRVTSHPEDAFLLVAPHIGRLQSLRIVGTRNLLENITQHISCPAPLLRELTIELTCNPTPVLKNTLFNRDLSSLRTLRLTGVVTYLPWKDLSKLTTFELGYVPGGKLSVTRLLDFFMNAPHLTDVTFCNSIPTSSNAPPERVVSLPHLQNLTIFARPAYSILLNHLSIPAGALLVLEFDFSGVKSPLPDYLPNTARNLKNLCDVTSVNLYFDPAEKYVRLTGPSGGLHIFGHWEDDVEATPPPVLDRQILRSLDYFSLHMTRRLAIGKYKPPILSRVNKSSPYYILCDMKDLLTLTLTRCNNLPFILALDPDQNRSKHLLCPKLEELVLFVEDQNAFNIPELVHMAKGRASKDAKLSSITIVGLGELVSGKEVFKLRKYVTRVDYRVEEEPPEWDDIAN